MDSIYGNEWKNREKDLLSADQISRMKIVQNASPPLVLNVAHWNCFSPWHVPFRKITDNLLLFIESGEFIVKLAHRELRLPPGVGLLIPENTLHSYELAPGCSDSSYYILHLLCLPNDFMAFFPESPHRLHYPEAFFEHLRYGIALRNMHPGHAEVYVCELLRLLIRECVADQDSVSGEAESSDHRIHQIQEFIKCNYAGNISVRDIADAVGLKEVQCRRIFQKATRMSPMEYLNRLRLLYAMRLLICSDRNVGEVASAVGFHSASYFCRTFRKFYRKSPEEQRKLYR